MFTQFENMFDKIKTTVKQQVQNNGQDYANTPQKYIIEGRQIQEIKLLSQGAFGFIWLAQDLRTKEQFALKRVICMTEERLRESVKQKQIMSVLPKSNNIVQFVVGDVVSRSSQKVVITVMQLCDGGTLFDLMQKRQEKGLSQQQVIKITLEILLGLQSIHSTGYYHRDIKIQNVILGKDKHYKLCDFGSCTKLSFNFAQINKKDYDSTKQQIQGMTTPMYRPPEIVDPYLKYLVNNKTDIWMTGCVLYTLSFFIHPFVDSNAIGIAAGTYRFPKYPEQTKYRVSDKIKDLIRHMLTPNPAFRPTAKQLIQLLRDWDSFTQVPLNTQAARRKKQQQLRQQQLEHLNKKCVDYDGDIPLQKLMQLQQKVKKTQVQEKLSSFVNKKGIQKLKDQKSYNAKLQVKNSHKETLTHTNVSTNRPHIAMNSVNSQFNSKDPFGSVSGKQVPKKQTNINQLWGNFNQNSTRLESNVFAPKPAQSAKNNQNSQFNFFDNFGSKSNNVIQSKNIVNFEQMFSQTPTIVNNTNKASNQVVLSKNSQKKSQFNLLDM